MVPHIQSQLSLAVIRANEKLVETSVRTTVAKKYDASPDTTFSGAIWYADKTESSNNYHAKTLVHKEYE
jgi:hypothetical protein